MIVRRLAGNCFRHIAPAMGSYGRRRGRRRRIGRIGDSRDWHRRGREVVVGSRTFGNGGKRRERGNPGGGEAGGFVGESSQCSRESCWWTWVMFWSAAMVMVGRVSSIAVACEINGAGKT